MTDDQGRKKVEGYGYRITGDSKGILIESRPRPRQKLFLVLAVLVGLIVIATAAALGKIGIAAAALAVAVGFVLFLYRGILIATKERLELGADGILRWVEVRKLSPETFEKPLYDITPDEQGARFLVKNYVHKIPGSRKLEGFPSVIWVYTSLGEGAGYKKVIELHTYDGDVEKAVDMIIENLPESRKK